jgi:uncharacterized protein DUF5336
MSNPTGQPSGQPGSKPGPVSGMARALAFAVLGLAVVIYLLGYAEDTTALVTSLPGILILGGGLLAGASTLPRTRRLLVPATVLTVVGVLELMLVVTQGPGSLGTTAIVAVLLAVLQLLAAIGALLLDQGLVNVSGDRLSRSGYGRQGGQPAPGVAQPGQYPQYPGGGYGGQYPGSPYGAPGGYPASGQPGQQAGQQPEYGQSPGGYGGYAQQPGGYGGYPQSAGYGQGGYPPGYGQQPPSSGGYAGYVPQQGAYGASSQPTSQFPSQPQPPAEPPAPRQPPSGAGGEPGHAPDRPSGSDRPFAPPPQDRPAGPTGQAGPGQPAGEGTRSDTGDEGAENGAEEKTAFIRPRPEDGSRGGSAG